MLDEALTGESSRLTAKELGPQDGAAHVTRAYMTPMRNVRKNEFLVNILSLSGGFFGTTEYVRLLSRGCSATQVGF